MSVYTASFRRFHRSHSFRREELALIEALERQRHRTGRVRFVIDSPTDRYTAVLQAYITYIQHLDRRDAIVVVPTCQDFRPSPELKRSPVLPLGGETPPPHKAAPPSSPLIALNALNPLSP